MAMIKCRACGMDISDKARKCPYCETVFVEETAVEKGIKCSECGGNIAEGDSICKSCGCPIEEKETEESTSSDLESGWFRKGEHKNVFVYGIQIACDKHGWILVYTDERQVHNGNKGRADLCIY